METTTRPRRSRSPNYPGIDVAQAIERATVLYRFEKHHPTLAHTALDHWGYKPKSGGGMVVLAALKKFGLIVDEGQGGLRKIGLTSEALDIIQDEREDSADRIERIRAVALRPAIHREMWDRYGAELPSDATLRYELKRERGFTDTGADEFISQYRRTLSAARLDSVDRDEQVALGTSSAENIAPKNVRSPSSGEQLTTVRLPLSADRWATLQATFPMSEAEWSMMMSVLAAMKPALVARTVPPDAPTETLPARHE